MADKTTTSKAEAAEGFSAPIADPGEGKFPDHINEGTLMAKGVDPETGQMVTVSLATLKKLHGAKKGLDVYIKVARAGGFFDPNVDSRGGNEFYPDLSLEGADKKHRDDVDKILKEA